MPISDKENVFITSNKNQDSSAILEKLAAFNPNVEPLLRENPNRFVVFPIEYPNIWSMYKQAEAVFWTTEEIDVSKDLKDWVQLSESEQKFILNLLANLGVSVRLLESLIEDLSRDVKVTEAICFLGLQISVESIHSEMYTIIADAYIKDVHKKEQFFSTVQDLPFVKERERWISQWLSDANKATFSERIVAIAVTESVLLASSFAVMFWLKKRHILPGLTTANEHIAHDEEVHTDFASLLFTYLVQKPSNKVICDIIKSGVALEKKFILNTLPEGLINNKFMCQYVEYVADNVARSFGCEKIYNSSNPFDFISSSFASTKDTTKTNINVKEDFNIVDNFDTDADF